jgi:hypothetical protein
VLEVRDPVFLYYAAAEQNRKRFNGVKTAVVLLT